MGPTAAVRRRINIAWMCLNVAFAFHSITLSQKRESGGESIDFFLKRKEWTWPVSATASNNPACLHEADGGWRGCSEEQEMMTDQIPLPGSRSTRFEYLSLSGSICRLSSRSVSNFLRKGLTGYKETKYIASLYRPQGSQNPIFSQFHQGKNFTLKSSYFQEFNTKVWTLVEFAENRYLGSTGIIQHCSAIGLLGPRQSIP